MNDQEYGQLLEHCHVVIDRKSRGYVDDALRFATFILADAEQRKELHRNLALVQERCTELLEENRRLKAVLGRTD